MYDFTFSYDGDISSLIRLPLAPEKYTTNVETKNSVISLLSGSEYNVLKGSKLRGFSFEIYLPKDDNLTDNRYTFHEPIFYLNKFRNYVLNKKPVRFIIIRNLPNGEEIFSTNLLVSFEDYEVIENAGEDGEFWVKINLKEYEEINLPILEIQEDTNGEQILTETTQRQSKEPAKTYTVAKGDTLWAIAKSQLNNGSRWQEIASLNNISNPNLLKIGQILQLPQGG